MGEAPERTRAGRLGRRVALSLTALVLTLAAAEWGLGRVYPVGAVLFRLDSELLHTTVPGARRMLVMETASGPRRVVTRINSSGFRGPELAPRGDRPRVAVYGDSLVLAENVELADTFVERLRRSLEARQDGPVEVVNAGVTGYGPDQTCLKLEREIDALLPDLVVLVLCANNDLGDLLRNKIFRFEDGGLTRGQYAVARRLGDRFARLAQTARRPALVRTFEEWRAGREHPPSTAASELPPYIQEYLLAARGEHADYLSPDRLVHSLFHDYYDADVVLEPDSESVRTKSRLMEAVLGRLRDECGRRSIPLVAVVVPTPVDLVESFDIRVDTSLWPAYDPARLTATWVAILERARIEHLDLFAPFRERGAQGLFESGKDIHWNADGQAFAAKELASFLERVGRLPL